MAESPLKAFVTYKVVKAYEPPLKAFITYKIVTGLKDTATASTCRNVTNRDTGYADTLRDLPKPKFADTTRVDTVRTLHYVESSKANTLKLVYATDNSRIDTLRIISKHIIHDTAIADTDRVLIATVQGHYDTRRNIHTTVQLISDTLRRVTLPAFADTGVANTARLLSNKVEKASDTLLYTDICETTASDIIRTIGNKDSSNSDTVRHIPYTASGLNPVQISISLQRGTISDSFQMVTPYDLPIESVINGKLLDFPYHFLVYESSGTGLLRTITGMYDVDQLLYRPINYSVKASYASGHAKAIAEALGKKLALYIDDFQPDQNYNGWGATIQNLVSSLFGWAGNIPQRWINVFLRNDTLYIVQRGHEPNTIDITDTKHSQPNIDRQLVRSVWSGPETSKTRSIHTSGDGDDVTEDDVPFSGTISFGSASCTYSAGLLMNETTTLKNGTSKTNYSYSGGYIASKDTTVETNDGGSKESTNTHTSYSYASTGQEIYLATETETTTHTTDGDKDDESTRTTQHVFLGNGWYGTATYVDGEFQGSVVSQGKPGGKTNPYTVKMANWSLHHWLNSKFGPINQEVNSETTIHGTALFDTSFPVKGRETLIELTKAIEWLNRKTEERITMDIWQYPHLIDFMDRVRYNGHDYYLESNQVTQTPTELKQTVELVRWY